MLLVTLAIGAVIALVAIVGVLVAGVGKPAPAPPAPAPTPARDARAQAPMVVTEMATRGFFAIEDASGRREEPLPDSPLGSGEFPMGLWVAPDHTVFVVGKLYTGRPGPDDGAVWRRSREGAWSLALRLPGRVIGHVCGRTQDEVVVGLMGGIATWDGTTWSEHALPYAMMWKVWSSIDASSREGELVAQAFDGSVAYVVSGGIPTMTSRRERATHRPLLVRARRDHLPRLRSLDAARRARAPPSRRGADPARARAGAGGARARRRSAPARRQPLTASVRGTGRWISPIHV
jgi:hypothetical protein